MFNIKITDSDDFLDLPLDMQALYFHLSMVADDDGFIVGAKSVARKIGVQAEALQELIKNRFLIKFESGVVAIRHWNLNNQVRKDRYTPTIYQSEFAKLSKDENGVYYENEKESNMWETSNQSTVETSNQSTVATQYSIVKDSVDKVSIVQDSIDNSLLNQNTSSGNNIHTTEIGVRGERMTDPPQADASETRERVNYQQIIDNFNNTCISLPKVKTLNDRRKKTIRTRLRTHSAAEILQAFELAEQSNFLTGRNGHGWQASFDWLMEDANMVKVLEGTYANRASPKTDIQNRVSEVDDW
jgi:hypothetical protein